MATSYAPLRLYETISAISHHDDLEKEWQGNHLAEVGAPLDFTLGKESGKVPDSLKKHIEESLYRSRWVALLTSMHICFLSQNKGEVSQEWQDFLDE
jgi:hypothetical protein